MNTAEPDQHAPVACVVGAGISGLSAAVAFVEHGWQVVVIESSDRVGGKLQTSPFAGIDHVDEGADAYLVRVEAAPRLATTVGLADIKHPTDRGAAVWLDGLHRLPTGLMLGVPASVRPLLSSALLTWRGKVRAGADLILPRSNTDHDSVGALIRARFGDEVHDRLVDALIGSIYATDTDSASLRSVPQLASLATGRSLALSARAATRNRSRPTPSTLFAAPSSGMHALATQTADWLHENGATVAFSQRVVDVADERSRGGGWRVRAVTNDDTVLQRCVDAVVFATPSRATEPVFAASGWHRAADLVNGIDTADVIMVRLRVPHQQWPADLEDLTGYLVPKSRQRWVTAASFGSQKWTEWRPENGDQIVRVSLGRDGMRTDNLDDQAVLHHTVAELGAHLGCDIAPTETSITRWVDGFAQYRPHHHHRVETIESSLPHAIAVAGASYHGIGIPACISSGRNAARRIIAQRAQDLG